MDAARILVPVLTACGTSDRSPCPSESQCSHLPKGVLEPNWQDDLRR